MRCIDPIWVRKQAAFRPCGKCNFCLMNNRADWTFRIYQESKCHVLSEFDTLTYEPGSTPAGYSLWKPDFQNFMKRLRKEVSPVKLRFYAVGEYGTESLRPHYHLILFGCPQEVDIQFLWGHGFVDRAKVEMASIHYVTKYHVNKYGEHGGREPPFALMSRRPGIGVSYLSRQMVSWHKRHQANYAQVNGTVSRLPRFYKEKIFTSLERARFEIESIDLSTQAYREAVAELARYHPDPDGYYYQRLLHMHDAITHKVNSRNKI